MFIILAFAVLVGILFGFTGRFLAAIVSTGRAITDKDGEQALPLGVTVGITPPWFGRVSILWQLGFIAEVIAGTVEHWWLGALALLISLVTATVARTLLPRRMSTYLRLIAHSLANRSADYAQRGDGVRAQATEYFFGRVTVLLTRAVETQQRVPDMREAKATPFGQIER